MLCWLGRLPFTSKQTFTITYTLSACWINYFHRCDCSQRWASSQGWILLDAKMNLRNEREKVGIANDDVSSQQLKVLLNSNSVFYRSLSTDHNQLHQSYENTWLFKPCVGHNTGFDKHWITWLHVSSLDSNFCWIPRSVGSRAGWLRY